MVAEHFAGDRGHAAAATARFQGDLGGEERVVGGAAEPVAVRVGPGEGFGPVGAAAAGQFGRGEMVDDERLPEELHGCTCEMVGGEEPGPVFVVGEVRLWDGEGESARDQQSVEVDCAGTAAQAGAAEEVVAEWLVGGDRPGRPDVLPPGLLVDGAAGDEGGCVGGVGDGQLGGDFGWEQLVVVVEQVDPGAVAELDSGVASGRGAGALGELEIADARVWMVQDCGSLGVGAVGDDDYFEVLVGLGEGAADGSLYQFRPAEGRDDDGDKRVVGGRLGHGVGLIDVIPHGV